MKLQMKSIVAILLLMLAFNLTATVLPVQAHDPGTGKYLTICITGGDGYVIATKVNSGETWRFDPPNATYKVGAGNVLLEPFAAEGYKFAEWIGDVNPDNTYRTEKYGVVTAVFEELTYTITASADPEGWIDPNGTLTVTHGDSLTFTFGPNDPETHHVSTLNVSGSLLSGFLDTYTFENVTKNHTIDVIIDPIGTVSVPVGPGGGHNVDEFVGATVVGYVEDDGVILGYSVIDEVPEETYIYLYVIAMDPDDPPTIIGEGVVYAFLVPEGEDPYELTIVKGDSIQAIYSDVNEDYVVDSTDTSIVAEGKNQPYNPRLDLDNDGYITNVDKDIVNENKGTILEDVTGEVFWDSSGRCFVTTIPMMDDDPGFRCW